MVEVGPIPNSLVEVTTTQTLQFQPKLFRFEEFGLGALHVARTPLYHEQFDVTHLVFLYARLEKKRELHTLAGRGRRGEEGNGRGEGRRRGEGR